MARSHQLHFPGFSLFVPINDLLCLLLLLSILGFLLIILFSLANDTDKLPRKPTSCCNKNDQIQQRLLRVWSPLSTTWCVKRDDETTTIIGGNWQSWLEHLPFCSDCYWNASLSLLAALLLSPSIR